jgi:MFS family permease
MLDRWRLLLGISVFWLALSMLFDGLSTLALPIYLLLYTAQNDQATALGLISFVGLLAGMLVQPVAGAYSDRLYPRWGRRGVIGIGAVMILISLAVFGTSLGLISVLAGYLLAQVSAGVAQSAQQGFIPDLVPQQSRGMAAGLKGFMDLGGAMLAFIVLGSLLGQGQAGLGAALMAVAAVVIITLLLTLLLVREPAKRQLPPSGAPSTLASPVRPSLADAFRLDVSRHPLFVRLVLSRFLFLLGTYAIGRFLLYFVADRLRLDPARAAEQAGDLLASLTFVTVLAAPLTGWLADRLGRVRLMLAGAAFSALGALLLTLAAGPTEILIYGGLMALGSAAFAAANWALTADVVPPAQAARFFGLANFGTAGAAAAAGLFGPMVDWANSTGPGYGYTLLFVASALSFVASAVALRGVHLPDAAPTTGTESDLPIAHSSLAQKVDLDSTRRIM